MTTSNGCARKFLAFKTSLMYYWNILWVNRHSMKTGSSIALLATTILVVAAALSFAAVTQLQYSKAQQRVAELTQKIKYLEENPTLLIKAALDEVPTRLPLPTETNSITTRDALGERIANLAASREEILFEQMSKLKHEDPEEYDQVMQRRRVRRKHMRHNLASRTATFMELDTTGLSETELKTHEQLLTIMAELWPLFEVYTDATIPRNRELRSELFNKIAEARPLMEEERYTLLMKLAADLNFDEVEAEIFTEEVLEIIFATSLDIPRGNGRRTNANSESLEETANITN